MPVEPSDCGSDRRLRGLERRLKAILFADVVDSVRLIQADEERTIHRWLEFLETLQSEIIPAHGGRLLRIVGDGVLVEFEDVADAVRLAFDMIAVSARANEGLPVAERMQMRIGINLGSVVTTRDQDVFGHSVNIASRLLTLAQPREIVATAQVRDALSTGLDAEFEDLGECYLRNVSEPVRAFRVHPRGANNPIRPMLADKDVLPTIAVIPFVPHNPEVDNYTLGEVLAEDIISALSRSGGLNVISRLSTTGFRMRNLPLAEIGAALSAEFVVSGRYSGDEKRVILDLELVEIRSGLVIWSERVSEDTPSLLQADSPVQGVAESMHRAILNREVRRALSTPLPTLESYTLLMGAIALMHRLSPSDFRIAREMLETLIDRAPRQPAPLAAMARWHVLSAVQGWTDSVAREASQALQCTRRALDLDPENVPALVAEGFALANLHHRLDEAEQAYDLALELSPNDAHGRLLRGTLYAFRGEGGKATRDTERALHLAPLDPHRFFFHSLAGTACIAARDYERALLLSKQSLRLNRMHTSTLRVKAVAEVRLGRLEEARATAAELLRLQPGLTVSGWLRNSPSASFWIGRDAAQALQEAGIPE